MTFAFARLRPGICGEAARVCHVLNLPETDETPSHLVSLCGRRFPQGMLEMMPEWVGMPCVACTVVLPIGVGPAEPAEPAPIEAPSCAPCSNFTPAAAFSGEALCHLLPEYTQRRTCGGRTVAISACGHLVFDWRDGSCSNPPPEWSVCSDCTALVTTTALDVRGGDGGGRQA